MRQANKRGTFEERKALALAKIDLSPKIDYKRALQRVADRRKQLNSPLLIASILAIQTGQRNTI